MNTNINVHASWPGAPTPKVSVTTLKECVTVDTFVGDTGVYLYLPDLDAAARFAAAIADAVFEARAKAPSAPAPEVASDPVPVSL